MRNPFPVRNQLQIRRFGAPAVGWQRHARSWPASIAICTAIVASFIAFSPACLHWFVLPVAICGALLTSRAVDAVLDQGAIFTVDGLFAVIGFHFFFLSPLLAVTLEHRLEYLPGQPDDWRDWLGRMAAINVAGLLAYQIARGKALGSMRPWKTAWLLDESRFNIVNGCALCVCGTVQIYLLVKFGGLTGFADKLLHDAAAWENTGWLFVIGESVPILAMIAFGQWIYRRRRTVGWPVLAPVLLGFLVAQILCGGLRGSRSNTITCLFWAVGIVNYCVRPVPRKVLALGLLVVMGLMYFGGFYKAMGTDAVKALTSEEERSYMSQRSRRTVELAVLEDLGRSEVQAFVLYRLSEGHEGYQLAWGQTYLGALALLIPKTVWPARPEGKVKWTTDVEYGSGTYGATVVRSSRVYGLMGEWMLNFGWYFGPLSMAALGLFVGVTQRFTLTAARGDCRKVLIPIVAAICVTILASDSDNDVYSAVKYLSIPLAVLWMSTRKVRLRGHKTVQAQ
jgi:hypothetical protein